MEPQLTAVGTPAQPNLVALYNSMVINPDILPEVHTIIKAIELNLPRYQSVANRVNASMPAWFIGFPHCMECSFSFNKHLHNGDPLSARTVHYPAGRPVVGAAPFKWEDSAVDALTIEGFAKVKDWSVPNILRLLEQYNGMGYRKTTIYSPYIWAGTNHYTAGKYKEVLRDAARPRLGYKSVWDAKLVSKQVGCAVIIKLINHAA